MTKGSATPWGPAQTVSELAPGVWDVTTAGHGGVLVANARVRALLHPAALRVGEPWHGFLAFEEDCAICAVLLEHPEWHQNPNDTRSAEERTQSRITTLSLYYPDYLRLRGLPLDTAAIERHNAWMEKHNAQCASLNRV